MIVDHISNREKYAFLGADFTAALQFFAEIGTEPLKKEDIRLENADVLVKVRPMLTKPASACAFEAHREYADIHYLAYGVEKIGYAPVQLLHEMSYDAHKDAAALEGTGDLITLHPGYFMITFPQDAHMPCVAGAEPEEIGKMIAKIKV